MLLSCSICVLHARKLELWEERAKKMNLSAFIASYTRSNDPIIPAIPSLTRTRYSCFLSTFQRLA